MGTGRADEMCESQSRAWGSSFSSITEQGWDTGSRGGEVFGSMRATRDNFPSFTTLQKQRSTNIWSPSRTHSHHPRPDGALGGMRIGVRDLAQSNRVDVRAVERENQDGIEEWASLRSCECRVFSRPLEQNGEETRLLYKHENQEYTHYSSSSPTHIHVPSTHPTGDP